MVSHAVSVAVSPHSAASSGAAALALNHSDMTRSSPAATTSRTRRLRDSIQFGTLDPPD